LSKNYPQAERFFSNLHAEIAWLSMRRGLPQALGYNPAAKYGHVMRVNIYC